MAQYAGNLQRDQANKSQGQGENPERPKQRVQTDYICTRKQGITGHR